MADEGEAYRAVQPRLTVGVDGYTYLSQHLSKLGEIWLKGTNMVYIILGKL
jgi:hypothetical protein